MELPIDYATLRVIWWALVGVLLIAFALIPEILSRQALSDSSSRLAR